jgi:hypothetical protein
MQLMTFTILLQVDHTECDRKTIEQFLRAIDRKADAIDEGVARLYLNLINPSVDRVPKFRPSMGKANTINKLVNCIVEFCLL